MDYELVLFDMDEVLVDYDQEARLRILSERSGATPQRVHEALFGSGFEWESDRGEWPQERYASEFSRRLGAPLQLRDCIDARAASMAPRTDILALAQAAAQRAQVAILTNNGLYMHGQMRAICPPLFPLFAGAVHFAAEYGAAKPDPQVYRRCLAERGAEPARTLFVDDKPQNVEGAREAGLDAVLFSDRDTLARDLERRGLA